MHKVIQVLSMFNLQFKRVGSEYKNLSYHIMGSGPS